MAAAPACEWRHFRDWALVVISCLLNAGNQGLIEESHGWGSLVFGLSMLADTIPREKLPADVDLFEVFELINWMSTIDSYVHPLVDRQVSVRTHLSKRKIFEATQTARQAGICQNRLWNLTVGGGEREEIDLPVLMMMLNKHSQDSVPFLRHREHKDQGRAPRNMATPESQNRTISASIKELHLSSDHDVCTAEVCSFSNIDSTRVEQLHKCSGKACGEPLRFASSRRYKRITWWLNNNGDNNGSPHNAITKGKGQYMAISHVWSDGTGGGVQGEGLVNRCLFTYFRDIARNFGCTAIWWDTISIPTERVARQTAISRMHKNFSQASHTIIHDQYLAQFPWTDDGLPCLALLLSPWFTRAWTALELMMSRKGKVSVIFRHPSDCSSYTIQNLDHNVLAHHPAYCSRGHWVASSLVRQLRSQQFGSIGDIMKVLRTRNSSWPRDLMVIAGLLTGHEPKVNVPGFVARTTRDIILGLVEIEESFLYHGHATMTQKGGFSWCPSSLLDVHIRTNANRADRADRVFVSEHGALTGTWEYRMLRKKDVDKVRPYSFHISVAWQIRTALEQWDSCLLLRSPYHNDVRALLVVPLDVGKSEICGRVYKVLECDYVGTIYTSLEWGPSYKITVRLGMLTDDANTSSEEVIRRYDDTEGQGLNGPPCQELHSIRLERRQYLATTGGE